METRSSKKKCPFLKRSRPKIGSFPEPGTRCKTTKLNFYLVPGLFTADKPLSPDSATCIGDNLFRLRTPIDPWGRLKYPAAVPRTLEGYPEIFAGMVPLLGLVEPLSPALIPADCPTSHYRYRALIKVRQKFQTGIRKIWTWKSFPI